MLEDLHDMLQKDPDAQVVANCMSVLLEVTHLWHACTWQLPAVHLAVFSWLHQMHAVKT